MNTVTLSRNLNVRDANGKPIADKPVSVEVEFDFPATVDEWDELVATNDKWPDDAMFQAAQYAYEHFLKLTIEKELKNATKHKTKDATASLNAASLKTIQQACKDYVLFYSPPRATRRTSVRAASKRYKESGDLDAARELLRAQAELMLDTFRDGIRANPGALTPEHKEYLNGYAAGLGIDGFGDELQAIADEALVEA